MMEQKCNFKKYNFKTPTKLREAMKLAREIGEIVGNPKITLEQISAEGSFMNILKNIPVADIPKLLAVIIEPTPPDDDTALEIYEQLITTK